MRIAAYKGPWSPQALSTLVEKASAHSQYFLLVVPIKCKKCATEILDSLLPFLVARRISNSWPGTIKLGTTQDEVFRFQLNDTTRQILIDRIIPELFALNPVIDDISLLREDGRPFLVTAIHERDAYFKVTQLEMEELQGQIGNLLLVDDGEDPAAEERFLS